LRDDDPAPENSDATPEPGRLRTDFAAGSDEPLDPLMVLEEQEASPDAGGQIRSGRLAGKSMGAAIAILAVPVLLQQTLTAVVGLVDKVISGSLPESVVTPAMDAIGIGSFVGWFIAIAMSGLGIGGQAIVARAMGAGDLPLAERAAGQALSLGFLWGFVVGATMVACAGPLARICGLTDDASAFCIQYVEILALSMPFCGVMMVGSMALHGAGDTVKPSVIAVATNVVNVVFSLVLSGVELRMLGERLPSLSGVDASTYGVMGIAGGTAISFAVGGIATAFVLMRGVKDLKVRRHALIPERGMAWRVVRIGIPNFFEGIAMWSVNFFILMFIGVIAAAEAVEGTAREGLVGAHIIAVQWEAFSFLPGFAMGTAAGALAGQYLGAGSVAMARRAIMVCSGIGVAFMGLLGIVFMTSGTALTRVISDQPVHLEEAPPLLFICGAVQVFFALVMVVRQALRGVGDTRACLAITVVSNYGVRLPLAWLLGVHLGLGLTGIWLGLCSELVVRGSLFGARFLQGGWAKVRV
jgi:putative MATE family efflux protein